MSNLNKTIVYTALGSLVVGLALGWLFFGGSHSEEFQHEHGTETENQTWTCSMHPQIRQPEAGKCPICGMELIPLDGESSDNRLAEIKMSPTAMQLASVQTAIVSLQIPVKEIRLNGKVMSDERQEFTQSTHLPGRIEKLMVNSTGEYVRKGQVLAYIYSPDLVTAQDELFVAHKISATQPELYQAARGKLKRWKLTDKQIDNIIKDGRPKEQFPILADVSGIILKKRVNLGDYLLKGQALFDVANLSKVWVLFDVYESDIPWIKEGTEVEFTVRSIPGKNFEGIISFIDPVINPVTRVARARIELSNSLHELKPDMLTSGLVKSNPENAEAVLAVPKSAVMWTGERSVIYVKNTSNTGIGFTMREVMLGAALGESYVLTSGLQAGEEIAINGTFSIDAAAQLAGKPSMMNPEGGITSHGHDHGDMEPGEVNKKEPQLTELPAINSSDKVFEAGDTFKNQLKSVFDAYLPVKDALVDTDIKKANEHARILLASLNSIDMNLVKGEAHQVWMKDLSVLKKSITMLLGESDVEKVRLIFSPLSDQLYQTLVRFQVKTEGFRLFCPMFKDNEGAFWLSDSDKVLNPYYGNVMHNCGEVINEIK